MRPENQSGIFAAQSPTDYNVNDFHKRFKISYVRDALIAVANLDKSKSPPEGFDSPNICDFEDAATFDSDSTSRRSSPAHLRQKSVRDGILGETDSEVAEISGPEAQSKSDHLLHKSVEPYRPPHLYKKLESKNLKACESSNVGYFEGIHHPESEHCINVVHTLHQTDGGTSENCLSRRKPLKKGTADEWQSLAALVTDFVKKERESEKETCVYPTWMFRNGCQSPGFTRANSFTAPGSSSTTGNAPDFDIGIEKGPKLNYNSGSDHASDLGVELSLPDEDSLHTFDYSYFVPDKEERIEYEDFTVSPERNSISENSSATSLPIDVDENYVKFIPEPRYLLNDVAEKVAEQVLKDDMPVEYVPEDETPTLSPDLATKRLVGSVLDDESCSPPIDFDKLVDSILDENPSPLDSLDSPSPTNFFGDAAYLSYPQLHHMQLNPTREILQSPSHGQVHGNTQKKSPNMKIGSLRASHIFQPCMISHPVHLLEGEQRRFEKTFPFSLHQRMQIEAQSHHLPAAFPMVCYEWELSPLQNFSAYQQPNYRVSPMVDSGLHAYDYNYNNSLD